MTILLITVGVICFFVGICVGAVMTLFVEGSAPHLMEMDDPYQPME